MALGATVAQVQFSVLGKTLLLTLIGIATGSIASLVVARAIARSFSVQLQPIRLRSQQS